MVDAVKIGRRAFLIGSSAVAGGVAFGYYAYKAPIPNPLKKDLKPGDAAITPFVKIDSRGVTLITPRADKGQGAYSIQTYLLAEELDLDPLTVLTTPGEPGPAYYNGAVMDEAMPGAGDVIGKLFGMQMTGGSSTVPDMYVRLREAGAVARETLKKAAARRANVSIKDLRTQDGHVLMPDGSKLSYAELAPDAAKISPVQKVKLRDPADWKYLGKPFLRTDIVAKSTGTQLYGIDLEFDGMLYATARTNPGLGGDMVSYDSSAAEQMLGVQKVVPLKHGIGVIADNTWRAIKAAESVNVEWGPAPYPATSAEMWRNLENSLGPDFKDVQRRNLGDVENDIEGATRIEAEYRTPHLAHAPLEPMNAVVLYGDNQIEVWTGTQIPRFIQSNIAKAHGLKPKDIIVHVEAMGGSFGRRLEYTYVEQAVEIAKAVAGTHVKMTWSREQDFAQDYPRPMTLARARGMVKDGYVESFDMDLVGASLTSSWMGRLMGPVPGPDPTLTTGADDQPYSIPNYRVTGYRASEMVPISSWRSVAASQNGFNHECFLDELIHAAGADPLEERIRLCNDPIAKAVLEEAGRLADWAGPQVRPGVARGVAMTKSFGVPTAEIVELEQSRMGLKIAKVWVVADVGKVLDPVNIEAQLFGGVIWGLGHAMNCELTYDNYAPEQTNYHQYEGMRLYQTPEIITKVLENGDSIKGIGEPGVPPAAPALANAVFAITGKRVRELPLYNHVTFA